MAGSVNKVILIGNLGRDPEVKHFDNGGSLARFPIATSETYTNKNGDKIENTDWHTIIVRGGLVDVASKYLKKGDKVFIEGKIRTRSYEDGGITKYVTEIITDNMTMLGSRPSGQDSLPSQSSQSKPSSSSSNNPQNSPSPAENQGEDQSQGEDDLPF